MVFDFGERLDLGPYNTKLRISMGLDFPFQITPKGFWVEVASKLKAFTISKTSKEIMMR